jgi:hypothetical protein
LWNSGLIQAYTASGLAISGICTLNIYYTATLRTKKKLAEKIISRLDQWNFIIPRTFVIKKFVIAKFEIAKFEIT